MSSRADEWHTALCCDNHADHSCTPLVPCWACARLLEINLRRLASNLAVAAGLCEAFRLGAAVNYHIPYYSPAASWRPGCGRSGRP